MELGRFERALYTLFKVSSKDVLGEGQFVARDVVKKEVLYVGRGGGTVMLGKQRRCNAPMKYDTQVDNLSMLGTWHVTIPNLGKIACHVSEQLLQVVAGESAFPDAGLQENGAINYGQAVFHAGFLVVANWIVWQARDVVPMCFNQACRDPCSFSLDLPELCSP